MKNPLLATTNQPSYQEALKQSLTAYKITEADGAKYHDFCLGHLLGWIESKQDTYRILDSISKEGDEHEPK